MPATDGATEPTVIGWREWVRLPDLAPDDAIKAKIDTGARTSAIHAWDIAHFQRDGEAWVRFSLHPRQRDDEHVVTAEARLVEQREVRSSNGEVENRCVVSTTLVLGDEQWPIELTLTKRDQMGFRMLLGRTAMAGRLRVDPGVSYRGGGNRHGPAR
ncbi:ATP-dependent zinc protease family protein [Actinospongicola halichondriae]|uniref:ATP-dependent zinc protease family protein n=1 Tax=Actinospongicola halichondriae TaxID=3236844 RepID=UPI003D4184A8